MSITTVRGSADGAGLSGSPCVPDFITRPGWYITALWPEMRLSPASIQRSATTSSRRVCRSGPALSTVPSGSTNMNEYIGLLSVAPASDVHTLRAGS